MFRYALELIKLDLIHKKNQENENHEQKKPKIAESILRANTILFQNSANAFDSYGESLMVNGDLEASLKNYQRAVAIAVANEDRNLELFQENLEKIKQKLKDE